MARLMRRPLPHGALVIALAASLGWAALPAEAAPRKARAAPAKERGDKGTPYASRADAMALADDIAARRGWDAAWVRQAIGEARHLPVIARLVLPPPAGTPKNWQAYRARFIEPVRVQAGVRFWQTHQALLERAEQRYGVPAEIIVGIVGVETLYGQHMGNFRVLDALATLALDFPAAHPRAADRTRYFRGELEHFLAAHQAAGSAPSQPRGSYAGASGMPQFMPSSIARWAVDEDGDGRIDLSRSAADVIGSVANYFKAFGWKTGMPTHYAVRFDAERLDLEGLLAPDILPTFTAAGMQARGALLEGEALAHEGPLALVELQNGDLPPSYLAGTENFYVITRYNWSSYYALAVIELGREVKAALPAARKGAE